MPKPEKRPTPPDHRVYPRGPHSPRRPEAVAREARHVDPFGPAGPHVPALLGADEPRLVGEDHGLHAIAQAELGEQP